VPNHERYRRNSCDGLDTCSKCVATETRADTDQHVGRMSHGADRTESVVRVASVTHSEPLRSSTSQHQSGLSDLSEAGVLVETLVLGRSSVARAMFHLQLLSQGEPINHASITIDPFADLALTFSIDSAMSKPLKPGEQSFRGGKMFCTEPCYNELFSGHCAMFDCKNPPSESKPDGAGQSTGDGPDERCLSCEKLMGGRKDGGQFPSGKFPGYTAAKQKHLNGKAGPATDASSGLPVTPATVRTHLAGSTIGEQCVRCTKPVYAAEFCYSMNLPWHLRVSDPCLTLFNCCILYRSNLTPQTSVFVALFATVCFNRRRMRCIRDCLFALILATIVCSHCTAIDEDGKNVALDQSLFGGCFCTKGQQWFAFQFIHIQT
jgi:hypothetical protein